MITRYNTIYDLVEEACLKFKDEPAFTCAGRTLSYSDLDRLSQSFASYLRNELGLQPGDRVALQMPNILQFPVAMYGVIRAGLVLVNTNPLYTPREIKHQLKDSGAKVLIVLSNVAASAAEIIQETDVETVIVTDFADLHTAPKKQIINFILKHVKKMVPDVTFPNQISFLDVVNTPVKPFVKPDIDSETLLVLQYTGGTTGVAKGAMLTHGNLASNVWQLISLLPSAFSVGREIYVACLPLYHIYALNLHGLAGFSRGEHNILIPNPRDLAAFTKALKNIPFTVFVGINTLYVALCRFEPFSKLDFSKLKLSCAGGMALTEDAAHAWESLTGNKVMEGYGLTETSPVVAGNNFDTYRPGTVGKPLQETEVKTIDDDGQTILDGSPGELCVRGPQVMKGYWQKLEETQQALDSDGWFKTGDIATLSEDGYVKLVDRKKDMILVSGFNVYPNEIEDVVCLHPKVVEAAAVGTIDQRCGEVVKLFVVRNDDSLSEKDVIEFCRKQLTPYKVPKVVEFRTDLPKTNVGKILRRELRD